jgi:hypothetical protein
MTPPSDVGQAARDLAAEPRIVVRAAATQPAARHHTTGSARPTPSTGSSRSRKRRGTPTTRSSSAPPTTAATSYIPAPPAIRRCQRHQPAHARALRDGTGDGLIGVAQAARTLRSATTSASRAAVAGGTWSLQPHNPLPRASGASAKRWVSRSTRRDPRAGTSASAPCASQLASIPSPSPRILRHEP